MIEIHSLSAIDHILSHRSERISEIIFHIPESSWSERLSNLQKAAAKLQIRCKTVIPVKKPDVFEPVTAILSPFPYWDLKSFIARLATKEKAFVLALDHLQDPQNLGALARTAEALGLDGIVIPKDRSAQVTAGAYHASVGAVETIPIVQVTNIGEALRKLKENECWIIGSSLGENSKPPSETPTFDKKVLVLGRELEGMHDAITKTCDWLVQIPLTGKVQSLNVSSAGAILMYELSPL